MCAMRKPHGYATLTSEDGVAECDTTTCAHCNAITHIRPKQDPSTIGGLCKICMGLICPRCVGGECVPFVKKLEEWEARNEALRSYGLTAAF